LRERPGLVPGLSASGYLVRLGTARRKLQAAMEHQEAALRMFLETGGIACR
jgi:hypothetical protein